MKTYISQIRGINVSGHKKILMADLRQLYNDLGFQHVTSYIQSGNVIFSSKNPHDELASIIQKKILQTFHFDVTVIVKTISELQHIIDSNPFIDTEGIDPSRLAVTFLSHSPSSQAMEQKRNYRFPPDEFNPHYS